MNTRKTGLEHLSSAFRNLYCERSVLDNEATVEDFFVSRMLTDLGYLDHQIKPKSSLDALMVGQGSRQDWYKPDYALLSGGRIRCVIEAKGVDQNPEHWVPQCSGYCLALNRRHETSNPVRYFVVSNGLTTLVYEWDNANPLLILDFSDFVWSNPKHDRLKSILGATNIAQSVPMPLLPEAETFRFSRPITSPRQLFAQCHKVIWKSEGYGPGPAFMAFVKLMFVKLWADQNLRHNSLAKHLFQEGAQEVKLPKGIVTFSLAWIQQRSAEGVVNPINDLFIRLRNEIEQDIGLRRKKRIFDRDDDLGLRPDTVTEVVRRLEHVDLFGIDEDLNGRLFETFLNATMRGRELM